MPPTLNVTALQLMTTLVTLAVAVPEPVPVAMTQVWGGVVGCGKDGDGISGAGSNLGLEVESAVSGGGEVVRLIVLKNEASSDETVDVAADGEAVDAGDGDTGDVGGGDRRSPW